MNWLDLGIIIFVIIFIIVGIKHGLMSSVLSNFSLSVNCLISYFLYRPIMFIYNKLFKVGGAIYSNYYSDLIEKGEHLTTNLMTVEAENLKSTVNLALNESGLGFIPKTMFKFFLRNKKDLHTILQNADYESRTVAQIISQTFSTFFVTIIAFVTSLIIMYILVLLFKKLAEKLRTVGFVKVVDNTFGAFYGIFRCFISLVVICLVVNLLSHFAFMDSTINYINDSFFGNFIYTQINLFTHNIIGI